jgi:hypothetical protein
MSSLRQQIVDAIKARLVGIDTGFGYNTNAGLHISTWRNKPFELKEMPGINLSDTKETQEAWNLAPNGGTWRRTLTIEIGFAAGSASSAGVDVLGRQVEADIEAAIKLDPTWGGLAEWSTPVSSELGVDQGADAVCAGKLTFNVIYRTDAWNSNA